MRATVLAAVAAVAAAGCAAGGAAQPQGTEDVLNYRAYDERLASAGAITEAGLERLHGEGLERVVFIGYTGDAVALAGEDAAVDALGMQFVQVPVRSDAPARDDFELFAAVMRQAPERRTLVHCSSNRRASAFAMLYRAIHEGVPVARAKADMNAIWTPNETWTAFILDVLRANGVDPDCEGCDWTPATRAQ